MSGYEGGGTDFGGSDYGGSEYGGAEVADAGSVNAGMSVEQQYGEYGAGRAAAELAAGYGLGSPAPSAGAGNYTDKAGTINTVSSSSFADYARAGLQAVAGLFGLGSPSPVGKVSGAQALVASGSTLSGLFDSSNTGRANDLGFAGNLGERSSVSVFEGGNREADAVAIGSPVLDYLGSPIDLLDRPGFAPAPGRALSVAQAARAHTPTYAGTPAPSNAGALVLAGLAAFALGS